MFKLKELTEEMNKRGCAVCSTAMKSLSVSPETFHVATLNPSASLKLPLPSTSHRKNRHHHHPVAIFPGGCHDRAQGHHKSLQTALDKPSFDGQGPRPHRDILGRNSTAGTRASHGFLFRQNAMSQSASTTIDVHINCRSILKMGRAI